MAITNPYIFGSPVKTKEMFFGREDVFAFLREHLVGTYQDNVIMLYGQRRTGKTSILYQILNNNRLGDDYVPVLISLEGLQDFETNAHVFLEIARRIAITLGIKSPEPEKFDATNSYFRYEFLEKTIKHQLNQRKLLLMFDEYEVLESCVDNPNTQVNTTLFHQLRYLMQHYDWLSFLLVGSHKLEELNTDYWKEFTGTIYHTISFLDSQSAQELIEKPAVKFSVYYTTDAIETLIELSGKHPYFLQSLCRFAYTNGAEKHEITKQNVEKAIEPCMEAIRNGFESIWRDLSNDEEVILSAIAHLISEEINISDIVGQLDHFKVNWNLERINQTFQQLEHKEILKKTELQQYQSSVPFFKECVKTYQSLEMLLDELNIEREKDAEFIHDPKILKAENYLRDAEEYAQTGNIKIAEKTFRYVIETYPAYINGWLRFGKFYEFQGRLDDALELYESRLEQYPDSVDASNAIGILLRKYNLFAAAWEQFNSSLEIQPDDNIALANIDEIKQQGLFESIAVIEETLHLVEKSKDDIPLVQVGINILQSMINVFQLMQKAAEQTLFLVKAIKDREENSQVSKKVTDIDREEATQTLEEYRLMVKQSYDTLQQAIMKLTENLRSFKKQIPLRIDKQSDIEHKIAKLEYHIYRMQQATSISLEKFTDLINKLLSWC